MDVCLVNVYVCHMCRCLWRPGGHGSLGAGIISSKPQHYMSAGKNSGPVQEQQVLFTAVTPLYTDTQLFL